MQAREKDRLTSFERVLLRFGRFKSSLSAIASLEEKFAPRNPSSPALGKNRDTTEPESPLPPPRIGDSQRLEHAPSPDPSVDDTVVLDQSAALGPGLPAPVTEYAPLSPPLGLKEMAGAHQRRLVEAPGDTLNDRYQILSCVGTGGVSAVYKALDWEAVKENDPEPFVAIKVLHRRFRAHEAWLAALEREADWCKHLVHPNIRRVYGVLRDGPAVYMMMEYLSGYSLSTKIRCKEFHGLPLAQATRIINAMGNALAFAHAHGVVHCDFKPANVFITDTDEVKLIDFGVARFFDRHGTAGSEATSPAAWDAVSPAYASPDILKQREPDTRDDVYALACTAYELLTGTHPFDYQSAADAERTGLSVALREGLTERQWKAIQHAMAFNRTARTHTATLFLREFNYSRRHAARAPVRAELAAALGLAVGTAYYLTSAPALIPRQAEPPALRTVSAHAGHPQPSETRPDTAGTLLPSAASPVTSSTVVPDRATATPADGGSTSTNLSTVEQTVAFERLYAKAQKQLATNRLTTPPGDNAWETLRGATRINASDPRLPIVRRALATRLMTIAQAKRQAGELRAALSIAEEGLRVLPTHTGLQTLRNALYSRTAPPRGTAR